MDLKTRYELDPAVWEDNLQISVSDYYAPKGSSLCSPTTHVLRCGHRFLSQLPFGQFCDPDLCQHPRKDKPIFFPFEDVKPVQCLICHIVYGDYWWFDMYKNRADFTIQMIADGIATDLKADPIVYPEERVLIEARFTEAAHRRDKREIIASRVCYRPAYELFEAMRNAPDYNGRVLGFEDLDYARWGIATKENIPELLNGITPSYESFFSPLPENATDDQRGKRQTELSRNTLIELIFGCPMTTPLDDYRLKQLRIIANGSATAFAVLRNTWQIMSAPITSLPSGDLDTIKTLLPHDADSIRERITACVFGSGIGTGDHVFHDVLTSKSKKFDNFIRRQMNLDQLKRYELLTLQDPKHFENLRNLARSQVGSIRRTATERSSPLFHPYGRPQTGTDTSSARSSQPATPTGLSPAGPVRRARRRRSADLTRSFSRLRVGERPRAGSVGDADLDADLDAELLARRFQMAMNIQPRPPPEGN